METRQRFHKLLDVGSFLALTFLFLFSQTLFAKTLTEKEVIALTYETSPLGHVFDLNKQIAETSAQNAKAQYDTLIFGNASHMVDKTAKSSIIYGTENQNTNFSLGLSQLTPTGTQFTLNFDNLRQKTDSTFFAENELFESEVMLGLTQPLLKNFIGINTRRTVEISNLKHESEVQKSDASLMELAAQNVILYWNWYYLVQTEKLNQQSVALAQKLYDLNLKKKSLGLVETSEVSAFAANLDLKKAELITTSQNKMTSEQNLLAQLGINENIGIGVESFTPKTLPSLDELLRTALAHNPTLASLKKQLAAQNLAVAVYKNSRLPQIDLQGSLALNGLKNNYGDALADLDSPHPAWTAGVALSFPLQNRAAKSQYKTTVLQKEQLLYQVKNTENQLMANVKAMSENCRQLGQKIKLLANAVENQKLKWQAEEIKYAQGRSDSDLIITYQNDYIQTQVLAWKTKIDLKVEEMKLKQILGQPIGSVHE